MEHEGGDLSAFIIEQLERVGVRVAEHQSTPTDLKAFCFKGHDSKTPSLSIRRTDGAFLCFGCGVKGKNWNVLATYVKAEMLTDEDMPDPFVQLRYEMERKYRKATAAVELPWDVEPWKGPYRQISEKTLKGVGALLWYDDDKRIQDERILLPIMMYEELHGWVARRLGKDPPGQKLTMPYRNAPNMSSQEVLYPFDYVVEMEPETVVLVEGPMDALRLVNYDIPALAIMGTRNYVPENRSHISNTGADKVIIAMDGDDAGDAARYDMAPSLREMFEVEHFLCPEKKDPGNMPKSLLDTLWRMTRKGRH